MEGETVVAPSISYLHPATPTKEGLGHVKHALTLLW